MAVDRDAAFQQAVTSLFVEISKTLSAMLHPCGRGDGIASYLPLLEPAKLRTDLGSVPAAQPGGRLPDVSHLHVVGGPGGRARARRRSSAYGPVAVSLPPAPRAAGCGRSSPRAPWCSRTCSSVSPLGRFLSWNAALVFLFLYGLGDPTAAVSRSTACGQLFWLLLLVAVAVLTASPRVGLFVILRCRPRLRGF